MMIMFGAVYRQRVWECYEAARQAMCVERRAAWVRLAYDYLRAARDAERWMLVMVTRHIGQQVER